MLAIECSPIKTRNRQNSAITAGLTFTKSQLKFLENYGLETFILMGMFVCPHICVSPFTAEPKI